MSDVLDRPETKPGFTSVGTRPIRPDGFDKVTGKAAYGADLVMPGMLHGRVKRSPYAHARILGIDIRKALALHLLKGLPRRAGALEWILVAAAAQILFLDLPDHAGKWNDVEDALATAEQVDDLLPGAHEHGAFGHDDADAKTAERPA